MQIQCGTFGTAAPTEPGGTHFSRRNLPRRGPGRAVARFLGTLIKGQMADVKITAVIPLHNKGQFIVRAIESVLAQTEPVDEIIVVDDASTDDSVERVSPFLLDTRLRLLRRAEPGPGGYAARNLAIRSARSRWIAFLDADDSWKPEFIAEIASMIRQASKTTGCVFTGSEKTWSRNRMARDKYSLRHRGGGVRSLDFDAFVAEWLANGMSPIWTSACAIRRDVLLEIGLFPEGRCRLGGDKDTWLRTLAHTNALSSPRPCATYHTVTEHQVTRMETFNSRPCLAASIDEILTNATGRRRRLLMRLLNLEVFEQALMAGAHERVLPEVFRGFYGAVSPVRYALLLGLAHLPAPLRRMLRMCTLRGRSLFQRLTQPSRIVSEGRSQD